MSPVGPLISLAQRSHSSSKGRPERCADPRVKRAKAKGSRAVFKLEPIDRKQPPRKPGRMCLELGAEPGACSQYARRTVGHNGGSPATDILDPVPGTWRKLALEMAATA